MDDAKGRVAIRLQAAMNKDTDVDAMGMCSSKPSAKRIPLPKGARAPKKQKVSLEPVLGLMAEGTKTVTSAKHGGGKGLMIPPPGSQKKLPVLLREDPKYALEKFHRSLAMRIMKTWETIQRRPWGRRASLVLPR